MGNTTLPDIMARFRAVLEATPLSLTPSADGFTHNLQPTTLIDNTYVLEDAGLQSSRSLSNYQAARIDRLRVLVALKSNNAAATRREILETTLLNIERNIKADGPAHGYHVDIGGGRQITQKKGSEFMVGSIVLTVDYDVSEAVAL